MPRICRFRIAAIDELYRQLRYAPRAARLRQMESAERLADEIDPGQIYPQDFVMFRVTGYRPEQALPVPGLVGAALVGDLAAFIQRLSCSLGLESDAQQRGVVPLADVARRLGVSAKTIARYRKRGLVCHYLVFPDGAMRLACFEDALQRFIDRHRGRVERAAGFSRVGGGDLRSMITAARDARRQRGLSLGAASRELALRYGRSPGTLRAILKRHDRESREPIFAARGSLSAREARLIDRASRMGVSPAVLARRLDRAAPTIHRAINVGRRRRLVAMELRWMPPAEIAGLAGLAGISTGLVPFETDIDAVELVERTRGPLYAGTAEAEPVLLAGYNLLKRRAAGLVSGLPEYPTTRALDAIETRLRWAALLKRRLVGLGLPSAVAAIEQYIGRPLDRQPADAILALVSRAIEVVSNSIESINPGGGQRLSHLCGYAMSRALAAGDAPPPAGRAATKHRPGSVMLSRPFERICPWQTVLGLRPELGERVGSLDGFRRQLVRDRYGLGGNRPRLLVELAARTGRTATAIARHLAAAETRLRELRKVARSIRRRRTTGGRRRPWRGA